MQIKIFILIAITLSFTACNNEELESDAYGNFEADDILVSAKGQGELLEFSITEGCTYSKGTQVGIIDTTQLYLQKKQLWAGINSVKQKANNVDAQYNVIKQELEVYEKTKKRISNLVKSHAATPQQLDEIEGKVNITKARLKASKTQKSSVLQEIDVLKTKLASLNEKINNCKIINPIDGIILEKYKKAYENVMPGISLYKIAPAESLILRVYVDGETLHKVKNGSEVSVLTDIENGKLYKDTAKVIWVANKAEFTPKIIQTRKERTKLVYAVKIKVNNKKGRYKIGMPAEIKF
ncbi:MAG: HlyD family efflux transporter periplasmic adaptor subunit [Bacteroidales bacterium]|jgi:HlyD family secretion protein|nr:HlyD family efflux transporter periplasmic adaptor subunit [Bacteroidales bacterium]